MDKIASIVGIQVFVMFALIVMGYILTKTGMVSKKGASDMSGILLTLVTPCVLIRTYQTELDLNSVRGLMYAFISSIAIHIILIALSALYFCSVKDEEKRKIDRFSGIYSNCGFMAIPLLHAAFGNSGVFYGSAYLAVFNLLSWSHGIHLYAGKGEKLSVKTMIFNPGIIGTVIALALYFLQIKLPSPLLSVVNYTADLNTPLAMILLGSFLARTNIISTFKNLQIYAVALFRLILSPAAAIILFKILKIDQSIAIAILISASCPTATLAALFAEKFDMNSSYGSQISAITTLYSIVTIPLMVGLAGLFIK